MIKIIPSVLIFLFVYFQTAAQTDLAGSGRALQFDGVDDYIDLGNIYDNLQFPLTISAWINKQGSTQYIWPIFASQDNAPLYNGFWFCLSATNLFFEYGDGRGEQLPAYRRGKSAAVPNLANRWIYVSAVVRSGSDIQLFANGQNVGGAMGGLSTMPMASNYPDDVAKIGYFHTNSVTHRFDGVMDELRIWNRALTENEIRETMCRRLKGDEPDLIGYWNFDETSGDVLKDLSPNGHDGILKGNPTRVFSGAPVGDESVFLYTTAWTGKTLSKDDVSVSNVSTNAYGVHIYSVNHNPSQTGGLDITNIQTPYYGVFVADDGETNTFDLTFTGNKVCSYYQREDNSEPSWDPSEVFSGIPKRIEVIPSYEASDLNINLGDDIMRCDEQSLVLEADPHPAGKTFLWSSGETTPAITVTSSGKFSVEVKQGCLVDKDTIEVTLLTSPPAFSLGEDEFLCTMESRTLAPAVENHDFVFTWQDGSKHTTILADQFGTYTLTLKNACGVSTDSITFSQQVYGEFLQYNFISPDNRDEWNQFFILDEKLIGAHLMVFNRWGKPVFESFNYQNNWDGNGAPAGVYFYTVTAACIEPLKGTLTIMR